MGMFYLKTEKGSPEWMAEAELASRCVMAKEVGSTVGGSFDFIISAARAYFWLFTWRVACSDLHLKSSLWIPG